MSARPSPSTHKPIYLTSYYTIAGRVLCIQASDETSAKILAKFIAGYYFAPITSDQAGDVVDQTIRVSSTDCLPGPPGGTQIYDWGDCRCYIEVESYYVYLNASLIVVREQSSNLVEIFLGGEPQAHASLDDLSNVLASGIQIALRRCGLIKIHAAGVVKPGGDTGALFLGNSGCGKSTLTLELATSGWHFLSDDALILSEDSGSVKAHGHRRRFALTEESFAGKALPQLPRALGHPFAANPNKRWVDPTVLFPNSFAESCIPRALFFSCIEDGKKTEVVRLSQIEVAKLLIQQCPPIYFDAPIARQHFRLIEKLVNQTLGYKLMAGRDMLDERGRASNLISSYLED